MFKQEKGITLIALIVTIIVLLILAGISIAMLTGDNGVLKQASGASYTNVKARVEEEVKLAAQALTTYNLSQRVANSNYDPKIDADVKDAEDNVTSKALLPADVPGIMALGAGYNVEKATDTITVTYNGADLASAAEKAGKTTTSLEFILKLDGDYVTYAAPTEK